MCRFCNCRNSGKNLEGIWDCRSSYKLQNYQRLQEKDFPPPFSIQESVTKWGQEYKEAYWFVEGKKLLFQNFLSWASKLFIDWGKPTAPWTEKESWTGLATEQAKRLKLEQNLEDVIRDLENRKNSAKKNSGNQWKKQQECKKGTKKVQTKVKNSVIKPNSPRQEYSEDFKKTAIQHF